ncbi:MAG: HDIG domain-containing protein [Polyangia bacterium]|jgi:poly(A) polymerase|nr:HDIG domain-containing protein [Polyangia bacterium]
MTTFVSLAHPPPDGSASSGGQEPRAALEEALLAPDPRQALDALRGSGPLTEGLPEVAALAELRSPPGAHHKDLWEHTLLVVAGCPPRLLLRWAALLHDIGKAPTRKVKPGGEVSFHGHEEAGAQMVQRDVAPRLGFSEEESAKLVRLVRHHGRVGGYHEGWSESAIGRLCRELEDQVEDLLALARADVTSRLPGRREEALAKVDALASRIQAWREAAARPRLLPLGLGELLMERLGLAPGAEVGRLRRRLEEAVRRGALPLGASCQECLEHLRAEGIAEGVADGATGEGKEPVSGGPGSPNCA